MPQDATSASERTINSASKTLKERRRAIQDAMKQGRSGELGPETISSFVRDSLDAIRTVLETVTGDQVRPLPNGQKDYLPLNHMRAQSIANQCVSVIGMISGNRRLRAGLLEKTDFTKGEKPALETSLAGGLVRHLAGSTGNDEITRNNHVLLIDFLENVLRTEVARSFKLPSDIHDNIAQGIEENRAETLTRPRETWQRIQRKLAEISATEPAWLAQSCSVVEDRLSHGGKAQPSLAPPPSAKAAADTPSYSELVYLDTAGIVEAKMAKGLQNLQELTHVGRIALAVKGFPQSAGLDKHNTEIVQTLVGAVRSERDSPLMPKLVASLVHYAEAVRGKGFAAAGIDTHALGNVIRVLPYDQAQQLSKSLEDVPKYRKAVPRAMEARQVAELQREIRHILRTDVQHGGERALDLLENTRNSRARRIVLTGTFLQDVLTAVVAPLQNEPERAYEGLNRLIPMAGSNLNQAGLTRSLVSGFAAYATAAGGWDRSLAILDDLAKRYPLLDNALQFGRSKGHRHPASYGRRPRSRVFPSPPLFRTDCFGAIDPRRVAPAAMQAAPSKANGMNPKPAEPQTQPPDAQAKLIAAASKVKNTTGLIDLLVEIPPSKRYLATIAVAVSMTTAKRNRLFSSQIIGNTLSALFKDAKHHPDRAYDAFRRYSPLIADRMPELPVSRRQIDGFREHARKVGMDGSGSNDCAMGAFGPANVYRATSAIQYPARIRHHKNRHYET